MARVDFGFIDRDGQTIYRKCFYRCAKAKMRGLEKNERKWKEMLQSTEEVFIFLVAEGQSNGFDVDALLEMPDPVGQTCFSFAESLNSTKICKYIIGRAIKLNSITMKWMIPGDSFRDPDLAIQLMNSGINPYFINQNGQSIVDVFPSSFRNKEARKLLAQFPRSVHYATQDIGCEESCSEDCPSNFRKFYYKNGKLVEMTDKNRIGSGGFGMVFKQLFHEKWMAMKCMLIDERKTKETDYIHETVSELEKNISELRIQAAAAGSGVIVPVAFVRQQNQEQDGNGQWIAKNYNIYIYPLYDCNLNQLHEDYSAEFTEEILADIIYQCLQRNSFYYYLIVCFDNRNL